MKLLAALALAAALALGQGRMEAASPGRFEARLPGRADVSAMTVLLTDTTGLVRDLTAGGKAAGAAPISAVPGRGNQLVIDWLSGPCEDYARFTLRASGSRYVLLVATLTTPFHGGGDCSLLVGIGRSVTVTLSTVLPADMFELRSTP